MSSEMSIQVIFKRYSGKKHIFFTNSLAMLSCIRLEKVIFVANLMIFSYEEEGMFFFRLKSKFGFLKFALSQKFQLTIFLVKI